MLYNKSGDSMYINYSEISNYINETNKIGEGKEISAYHFLDKVIKIFHKDRKTPIKRISDMGLIKLTELPLICFNTPIDLIYDGGTLVGYTEKYLEEKGNDFDKIDYNSIKKDLYTLSENGFSIEDLFYNYIFTEDKLYFTDLTCYSYIKTDIDFIKMQILKRNTVVMNNFLIGLTLFDAFQKGKPNEYTKMYLANEYRLENCNEMFYGDFIKKTNNIMK